MNIEEKEWSAIGRYIRNIADIIQKCNDIRIADMLPKRSYIRSTADITELGEITWALFPVMKLVVIYESFQ